MMHTAKRRRNAVTPTSSRKQSRTPKDHEERVEEVIKRLDEFNLANTLTKCEFAAEQIEFLGHHISHKGIQPRREKVDEILNFPRPTSKMELKRFIGTVNFYRKFLKDEVCYLSPLGVAASTQKKRDLSPIKWTEELIQCFEKAKQALAETTLLAHPANAADLALRVDASDTRIGRRYTSISATRFLLQAAFQHEAEA